MRRIATLSILLLSSSVLAACGGSAEDSKVTETRMDDIDSIEGSISDDSVNTDESTEEAPVDAAPPTDAKPKTDKDTDKSEDKKPAESKSATPAPAETEADDNGE